MCTPLTVALTELVVALSILSSPPGQTVMARFPRWWQHKTMLVNTTSCLRIMGSRKYHHNVGWPYDHVRPRFHLSRRARTHAFDLHAFRSRWTLHSLPDGQRMWHCFFPSARQGRLANASGCNSYVSWTWTRFASWWHWLAAGKHTSDRPSKDKQV